MMQQLLDVSREVVPTTCHSRETVDIVIPVLNEAHVIHASLARLVSYAEVNLKAEWRILVVDNGSTDDTGQAVRRFRESDERVHYVWLPRRGRGRALRYAWTHTDAEYSVYCDVDLSTELEALPKLLDCLTAGADVVTGSRLHPEAQTTRCMKREVLSRGYNWLLRTALRTRQFDDAQCGFKGVRISAVQSILPTIENQNWFFDTELLVLAEYAGLCIKSIPIVWVEDTDSRVNIPKTIWEDICGVARLWQTAKAIARSLHRDSVASHRK